MVNNLHEIKEAYEIIDNADESKFKVIKVKNNFKLHIFNVSVIVVYLNRIITEI